MVYVGNKQFMAGPGRLRCEECQEIGLEKRQESGDAKDNANKELGLDAVSERQPMKTRMVILLF